MEALQFPVGRFEMPEMVSREERLDYMAVITSFPSRLSQLLHERSDAELAKRYRPEGWTARQVVHHCADSHMNAFIRFKLSLTEDNPTIRPYFEDRWAMSPEYGMGVNAALNILKGVHERWAVLLESMTDEHYASTYVHPEYGISFRLDQALASYEWHCRHHAAHIEIAFSENGLI